MSILLPPLFHGYFFVLAAADRPNPVANSISDDFTASDAVPRHFPGIGKTQDLLYVFCFLAHWIKLDQEIRVRQCQVEGRKPVKGGNAWRRLVRSSANSGRESLLGLCRSPEFRVAFDRAKERIREMDYRFVEEPVETRQALLEI